MTPAQKEVLFQKIEEELKHIHNEIISLQELTKPIAPECALGDLARFELMNDQVVSEKTLQEALLRQKRLQYALRKIKTDEYRLCEECEEEIAYERLFLLPEAILCIECAAQKH